MEESKELQKLYGFMQAFIYITVCIEILLFVHFPFSEQIMPLLSKMAKIPIYSNILYYNGYLHWNTFKKGFRIRPD